MYVYNFYTIESFFLLHSKIFINELEKNIKTAFQPVGHKLTTLKPTIPTERQVFKLILSKRLIRS